MSLSYTAHASWHTAPETWRSHSFITHSTRHTARQVTPGGQTTGGTTSAITEDRGMSTASTSSQVTTRFDTGGAPASGTINYSASSTFGATSSSFTSPGGSNSGTFSRVTFLSTTSTSTADVGNHFSTTGPTQSITRFWPSTISGETTTTGGGGATGTASTVICVTAASTSSTGTVRTTSTTASVLSSTVSFSSIQTTTTGTGQTVSYTSSTSRNDWLELVGTVIHPNAFGAHFQDVLLWVPTGISEASTIGLWHDFFSTAGLGSAEVTIPPFSRHSILSTVWLTHALSTSQATYTETTTGTTSTITGTQLQTSVAKSLNGQEWNETSEDTVTITIGTLTGESIYTVGEETYTDFTYTRQTTGYDESSQFTTGITTETWFLPATFSMVTNSWDRSYSTTSSFLYPLSTTTTALVRSSMTDGWFAGEVSTTLEEWTIGSTTISLTDADGRTNAPLIGNFTSSGITTNTDGSTTTEGETQSVAQTWQRTDYSEALYTPYLQAQSDQEFFRVPRVFERVMARGFLGFGTGFSDDSPVYAGMTSSIVDGAAPPGFSLVADELPRFVLHPHASVFVTSPCWLEGHIGSSTVSATWLGTESGSRISASLAHRWTTTSGVTDSTVTMAGTYAVGLTGLINGEFFSSYEPYLNTFDSGIGRPAPTWLDSAHGGGAMGGTAAISSAPPTASFPPGALTLTWVSGGTSTASSSRSTSTGEMSLALPSASSPIAFSFEPAIRFEWLRESALRSETASAWYLPPSPWTARLQT